MSTPLRYKLLRITLLCGIVVSVSLALVSGASANVRVPSGDMPFYAPPFCPTCITHNDEWAVIPFYRPTSCVPADFNLITLVDYPRALACTPHTTEGFEIWADGTVPLLWQLHGLGAVPVWFVRWPELQGALVDGVLTTGELKGLPSLLRGTATSYKQTARNESLFVVVVLQITARGTLEDGRGFDVVSVTHGPDSRQNTKISFR